MNGSGHVTAVCAGDSRGTGKREVRKGYLRYGYGLIGDAHAGAGDRQVSLVALADLKAVNKAKNLTAGPGDFAANVAVAGLNLTAMPIGTWLRVGQAMLEVTHIGKDPSLAHNFSFQGVSLLVEKGVFCKVLGSGWVRKGDVVEIMPHSGPKK